MLRKFAAALTLVAVLTLLAPAADLGEDLLAAAKKGDVVAVEALLARGADVNAKNAYGATALSYAADKGHLEVVRVLLKHKAEVNVKDTFYSASPLDWALMRDQAAIVKALVEAGADGAEAALKAAAASGKTEIVQAILDTKKVKEEGLTKALAATPAKHTAVVEALTRAGAKTPEKVEAKSNATPSDVPKDPVAPKATVDDPAGVVQSPMNWPSFRGPHASGVADGQFPPVVWDVEKNRQYPLEDAHSRPGSLLPGCLGRSRLPDRRRQRRWKGRAPAGPVR